MFKNIVVGIDGSGTANQALEKAAQLAKATGARLHVVSAFDSSASLATLSGDPLASTAAVSAGAQLEAALKDHTARLLEDAKGALKEIDVDTYATSGEPADVLIQIAEEAGAELIVVGNKGMRGAKRLLLGSVPNRVAHHAPCDVWIVHTS
jgi:nucleotide-binding universal stress UspA family protein